MPKSFRLWDATIKEIRNPVIDLKTGVVTATLPEAMPFGSTDVTLYSKIKS